MAGPITWRNIGSNVSNVSPATLTAGTTGVRQFLDSLGTVIAGQQDQALNNAKIQREANTQGYLDQVGNASLEDLTNPEFVAGLQSQRDAQGLNLDRDATRDAVANQVAKLQKSALGNQAFNDVTQEVAQRGEVDQLRTRAAAGDSAGVDQILAQREFHNEGELRKELASVQDNLQTRQYRQNGEIRAENAADRAAESHSLSMTSAQENLAYNREVRADARKVRENGKIADSIVDEVADSFQKSRASTNEMLRGIGAEMQLPTGMDGLPDLSAATPEQRTAYETAVKESGVQANLSDTDERRALVESIEKEGLGPEAKKRALSNWEVSKNLRGLTPEDAAKAEATVAAANAGIDRIIEGRTTDFERESSRNPFLVASKTPIADVNKLVGTLNKEGFGTESDRREINNMLINFATNGMTVKGADGQESAVVVPTAILENAINTVGRGWIYDSPDDLEKRITSIMAEDGMREMAKEAPVLRQEFLSDMDKLNNEKLGNAVKVTRSAQRAKGVTINPNDVVTSVLNQR